jgi:hypothetical protein
MISPSLNKKSESSHTCPEYEDFSTFVCSNGINQDKGWILRKNRLPQYITFLILVSLHVSYMPQQHADCDP